MIDRGPYTYTLMCSPDTQATAICSTFDCSAELAITKRPALVLLLSNFPLITRLRNCCCSILPLRSSCITTRTSALFAATNSSSTTPPSSTEKKSSPPYVARTPRNLISPTLFPYDNFLYAYACHFDLKMLLRIFSPRYVVTTL